MGRGYLTGVYASRTTLGPFAFMDVHFVPDFLDWLLSQHHTDLIRLLRTKNRSEVCQLFQT